MFVCFSNQDIFSNISEILFCGRLYINKYHLSSEITVYKTQRGNLFP